MNNLTLNNYISSTINTTATALILTFGTSVEHILPNQMFDNSTTSMSIYHLPQQKIEHKGDALQALFQKWIDEDSDQEMYETFEYLVDALDRDRLSYRKIFQ